MNPSTASIPPYAWDETDDGLASDKDAGYGYDLMQKVIDLLEAANIPCFLVGVHALQHYRARRVAHVSARHIHFSAGMTG